MKYSTVADGKDGKQFIYYDSLLYEYLLSYNN